MRVTVFGITGYTGGNLARELLARGHEVTGIARHLDGAPDNVTLVPGSVFDQTAVTRAFDGADAVLVAVKAHGDQDLPDALPALLDGAARAGARVGIVGGAGSLLAEPGGPRLIDGDFPDEWKPEAFAAVHALDALRATTSDADWFFVSPAETYGSWNAGERTGSYRVGGDVVLRDAQGTSAIGGEDFAIALVDELERPAHHRERFTVSY